MEYKETRATGALSQYVECYWMVRSTSQNDFKPTEILLPDGTIDLVISQGAPYQREEISESHQYTISTSHLIGQSARGVKISQGQRLHLTGIRFKPYGLAPFVKSPVSEFTNLPVRLDDIFKGEGKRLEEGILNASSFEEQIMAIEQAICPLIQPERADSAIRGMVEALIRTKGMASIQALSQGIGLSPKALERRFVKVVGITPKLLARIFRFNHFLSEQRKQPNENLTSLAHECGYFDQSHLIKDFKHFTGVPPKKFLKNKSALVDLVVKYSITPRMSGALA